MNEFEHKQALLLALLDKYHLDGLLLQRSSSLSWATCGASLYVNTAASNGIASLWIDRDGRYLFTNRIEEPRLIREEGLQAQGWTFRVNPWYEAAAELAAVTAGKTFGTDQPLAGAKDLSADLARLRAVLVPEEQERFRALARDCAAGMDAAARAARPGQSEFEIAARLDAELRQRGCQAIVNLIASDERIFAYRHPLPTARRMEHYVMLVVVGRRHGLSCSLTRLVHFGRLPDEVQRKAGAVAQVDAAFLAATRPGAALNAVLASGQAAYARLGFADEWKLHHQGGPAGYEPREWLATPDTTDVVRLGEVYAWNPSITGVKSEDTILVGAEQNEVLTAIPGWPVLALEVDGHRYDRPAILEM